MQVLSKMLKVPITVYNSVTEQGGRGGGFTALGRCIVRLMFLSVLGTPAMPDPAARSFYAWCCSAGRLQAVDQALVKDCGVVSTVVRCTGTATNTLRNGTR
jgi:hypothetical protein